MEVEKIDPNTEIFGTWAITVSPFSSRYSKLHYLNLYYDESLKSRYCKESH